MYVQEASDSIETALNAVALPWVLRQGVKMLTMMDIEERDSQNRFTTK